MIRLLLAASLAVQTALTHNEHESKASQLQYCNARVTTVFQFDTNGTIIENLAVRSNGNLLLAMSAPAAQVWEVNPNSVDDSAQLVVDADALSNHSAALGITEIGHDVFAVISGDPYKTNTFNIHTIDFTGTGGPAVALVASIPEALLLNGLTTLNAREGTILASDSSLGVVYRINIDSGQYSIVLRDPSMAVDPQAFLPIGVNGIRKLRDHLYYTNSGKRTLSRVAIKHDGTAAGPYELVANVGDVNGLPDDFAVLPDGTTFITGWNEVVVVEPKGAHFVLAGGLNQTVLAGSTSAQFGRRNDDRNVLYVSTSGGSNFLVNGTFEEPGFVAAIELRGRGYGG